MKNIQHTALSEQTEGSLSPFEVNELFKRIAGEIMGKANGKVDFILNYSNEEKGKKTDSDLGYFFGINSNKLQKLAHRDEEDYYELVA